MFMDVRRLKDIVIYISLVLTKDLLLFVNNKSERLIFELFYTIFRLLNKILMNVL